MKNFRRRDHYLAADRLFNELVPRGENCIEIIKEVRPQIDAAFAMGGFLNSSPHDLELEKLEALDARAAELMASICDSLKPDQNFSLDEIESNFRKLRAAAAQLDAIERRCSEIRSIYEREIAFERGRKSG